MSKNSFTKNFNSCVAGFPIASVAAHMVLHEGIIKDIGKIALPAAALAGLYNYGDDAAEWVGDHINKDVGDKLGDWHRAGKEWTQDTWLGQKAGLGGDEAADRRYYTGQYNTNMAYAANDYANKMAALNNQRVNGDANGQMMSDEEYQKQKAQIDQDFAARKSRAGNLAYNDTIAHAQQNGRSVPAWKPDERNGFFDQNSKASGGDLHQAERDSGIAQQNANYEAQKNQFNASMNRAGQAKSAFLANQAERKISGDMTGDGTYIPPKQQAPAAQPVPAQPAAQTQFPPSQPAPAQPAQQAPAATPDPNAQQTQTLKAPDPALTSTNERVSAGQPAPAAQQPQAPAPQRDVAARPKTPSYIPQTQPASGQSAFDIAKNAAMHAGINTAIQTGMRRMMTPKPQAKPLPPGRQVMA